MAAAALRLAVAALLLLAAGVAGAVADDEATARRVKSGTGFFVSPDGFLVTSAHVVSGCGKVSVWGADGSEHRSYTVASDPRLDLALLWADGGLRGPAAIAGHRALQIGEDVFTLGFGVLATKPLQSVLVEGSLAGNSTAQPGNRILIIKAKLHAGNSGGAVLSGDGSLVGMVIGRDEAHPELGVAIPSTDIETLLSGYGIALPSREPGGDPRNFLGAISVLIQCSKSR